MKILKIHLHDKRELSKLSLWTKTITLLHEEWKNVKFATFFFTQFLVIKKIDYRFRVSRLKQDSWTKKMSPKIVLPLRWKRNQVDYEKKLAFVSIIFFPSTILRYKSICWINSFHLFSLNETFENVSPLQKLKMIPWNRSVNFIVWTTRRYFEILKREFIFMKNKLGNAPRLCKSKLRHPSLEKNSKNVTVSATSSFFFRGHGLSGFCSIILLL